MSKPLVGTVECKIESPGKGDAIWAHQGLLMEGIGHGIEGLKGNKGESRRVILQMEDWLDRGAIVERPLNTDY
jgi:hypothetical protein